MCRTENDISTVYVFYPLQKQGGPQPEGQVCGSLPDTRLPGDF